jgi:hypothetical protein
MAQRPFISKQFAKIFIRTAVDGCILPGTMMGTELTWLYLQQWRKEYSTVCFTIVSILFSNLDMLTHHQTIQGSEITDNQKI